MSKNDRIIVFILDIVAATTRAKCIWCPNTVGKVNNQNSSKYVHTMKVGVIEQA